MMGLVAYRGRWQRPEAVGDKVKADAELGAALAEYNARREKAANTAEAHWRLALWCEEKGLQAEASAHLATSGWSPAARRPGSAWAARSTTDDG